MKYLSGTNRWVIKMNRNDWLNFEIYIGDLLEKQNIMDAEKLGKFSDELHQQLEMSVQDYANGIGMNGYEPVY